MDNQNHVVLSADHKSRGEVRFFCITCSFEGKYDYVYGEWTAVDYGDREVIHIGGHGGLEMVPARVSQ